MSSDTFLLPLLARSTRPARLHHMASFRCLVVGRTQWARRRVHRSPPKLMSS